MHKISSPKFNSKGKITLTHFIHSTTLKLKQCKTTNTTSITTCYNMFFIKHYKFINFCLCFGSNEKQLK